MNEEMDRRDLSKEELINLRYYLSHLQTANFATHDLSDEHVPQKVGAPPLVVIGTVEEQNLREIKEELRNQIKLQRVIEPYTNVGDPEVMATLRVLNNFNTDMMQLAGNVNKITELVAKL